MKYLEMFFFCFGLFRSQDIICETIKQIKEI